MKCKTSPKRDEQVEAKTKTSSSHHSSLSCKKHGSKDNKGRYKPHLNSFFDFEPHNQLNKVLWNMVPCTFYHSHNHSVKKCQQRKELLECGNETRKKNSLLGSKTMSSSSKHKNLCTHCNISGHWVEKCWKLHPQLHPRKGKQDKVRQAKHHHVDSVRGEKIFNLFKFPLIDDR